MALATIDINFANTEFTTFDDDTMTVLELLNLLINTSNECIDIVTNVNDTIATTLQNLIDTDQLGYIENGEIDALFI